MRTKIALAILCAGLLLMECANATGGSTETSSKIASMVYNPGGSPAKHAKVRFFPVNYNPRTGGLGKTAATIDSTYTDTNGNYVITLDTGIYYTIQAGSDSGLTFNDSVKTFKDSTVRPDPDTLKPAGSIKGIVRLEEGGDPTTVFILFMGTRTFTFPDDTSGSFTSDSMAAGDYRVRILTTTPNYRTLDTTLRVIAGTQNVLPGPLVLQYTGIPTPTGLRATYDTATGKIFLSWNKLNQRIVGGYIVYRNDSSSTIPVNISGNAALKDTFFVDSVTVNPFDTNSYNFQYRLKAQDTATNLGTKYSDPIRVAFKIYPIWSTVGDLSSTSAFGYKDFALDNNGVPYVGFLDYNSGLATVMRYTGTTWELVGQAGFSNGSSVYWEIKFDHNNIPYLSTRGLSGAEIWRFNGSSWVLIGSLGDVTEFSVPMAISDTNIVYTAIVRDNPNNPVIVQKYDTAGWSNVGDTVFAQIPTGFRANVSLAVDKSGLPYVVGIDENNGYKCSVKKFNGTTWEYVGTPGFSNGTAGVSTAYQTQITIDNAGIPYVAFSNSTQAEIWRFNNSSWEQINSQNANSKFIIQIFFAGNNLYTNISHALYQYSGSGWKLVPTQSQENFYAGDSASDVFLAYRGDQDPYPIRVMKLK
jgi:hypothetical protein